MDGSSRAKLVKAGYKIFRLRDVCPITDAGLPPGVVRQPVYQIREMSFRGQWVLEGTYPTKTARTRAWKELDKDDKHIMEGYGEDL